MKPVQNLEGGQPYEVRQCRYDELVPRAYERQYRPKDRASGGSFAPNNLTADGSQERDG